MRSRSMLGLLGAVLMSGAPAPFRKPAILRPNPNTARAGVLRDGVLTIALEAKQSVWHLNGDARPAMTIEAFSEAGKEPMMPGPLIRAPQGSEIHLSVRNSLPAPITFFIAAAMRGVPGGFVQDSVVVA